MHLLLFTCLVLYLASTLRHFWLGLLLAMLIGLVLVTLCTIL